MSFSILAFILYFVLSFIILFSVFMFATTVVFHSKKIEHPKKIKEITNHTCSRSHSKSKKSQMKQTKELRKQIEKKS
jgi:hypothetical protein